MYQSFLSSHSKEEWQKIGLTRRAGVAVPLFSVYSKKSVGVGELPDLKLLIDWCCATGMSILQLLPMNDVGFAFRPYDAQSSFALEPMYLSIDRLTGIKTERYQNEIASLRKTLSNQRSKVNYKVKAAKLDLLWKIFTSEPTEPPAFQEYRFKNQWWLTDYACYKAIKEENSEKSWEEWPEPFRERNPKTIEEFNHKHGERVKFYEWLQWQLHDQFKEIRGYAKSKNIFIMGDLPFLAARDSADVWAHRAYFKLNLSSGAPPDAYFFKGQRWGAPPCEWSNIEKDSFRYVIEKLKYAQNFYDLLRIDHAIGFFRLWSIPVTEPLESGGLNGFFDPADESQWEGQGRKLLSEMIQNSKMLICAEDLGTVPECSYRVLKEFAIPGMDVQRWMRDPQNNYEFQDPEAYRENSIATLSTHDMASFSAWWEYEAGTVYEPLFERKCLAHGVDFQKVKSQLFDLSHSLHERLRWKKEIGDTKTLAQILGKQEAEIAELVELYQFSYGEKEKFWSFLGLSGNCEEKSSPSLVKAALKKISGTASIFSVQSIQDWLALGGLFKGDSWEARINFPGTASDKNWSLRMPVSLEEMNVLKINKEIKTINQNAERIRCAPFCVF